MSRSKKAHTLIDQAAAQATTFVDQAAGQASALVDQMAPHVEAARDRVVTEYVPQARKAGRRARKQVLEAAAKAPVPLTPQKEPKRRGRTAVKLLVLIAVGTAIGSRLRNRALSPAAMYEAPTPTPTPTPAAAAAAVETVPPGAVGEPDPQPEDLQRLDDEAPEPAPEAPPADSLNSFFDEVLDEDQQGSHRG